MIMARKQQVDTGLGDGIQRQLLPTDRLPESPAFVEWKREHRMMGDKDLWYVSRSGEGRANETHLFLADSTVLEGEGARGVDPENRRTWQFMMGAQGFVDITLVARQR